MSAPTVKDAANRLRALGYVVVPKLGGQKRPAVDWAHYQATKPTDAEHDLWFGNDTAEGMCLITGRISGNVEMLELEGRAVADGTLCRLEQVLAAAGLGEVWRAITSGLAENSPSGGIHWYYRVSGTAVLGNAKLARDAEGHVTIETRAEGGLSVVAPSTGHPNGGAWTFRHGCSGVPATIAAADYERLHAACRTLDQTPVRVRKNEVAKQRMSPTIPKQRKPGEVTPWDEYNQRHEWCDVLPDDWELVREHDGVGYWLRPGDSTSEYSATTNYDGKGNLWSWSTSTVFDAETPYTKFGVYALLHHDDDVNAAAKALRSQGYGSGKAHAPSAAWVDWFAGKRTPGGAV